MAEIETPFLVSTTSKNLLSFRCRLTVSRILDRLVRRVASLLLFELRDTVESCILNIFALDNAGATEVSSVRRRARARVSSDALVSLLLAATWTTALG